MNEKKSYVVGLKVFGLDPDCKTDRRSLKDFCKWLAQWHAGKVLPRFSRTCGCRCGCSPGFMLFFEVPRSLYSSYMGPAAEFKMAYHKQVKHETHRGASWKREPRTLHVETLGDGQPSMKRVAKNMQERLMQMGLA